MSTKLLFIKDADGAFWVSGRSLCQLTSGYTDPRRDFTNWLKYRGTQLFNEGSDYKVMNHFPKEYIAGLPKRNAVEYLLSFDMALKMAEKERPVNTTVVNEIKQFNIGTATYVDLGINPPVQPIPPISIHLPTPPPVKKATENVKLSTALSSDRYAAKDDEITVFTDVVLGNSVSMRELYSKIAGSPKTNQDRDRAPDWFRARIAKLNLIEGKDYVTLLYSVKIPISKHKVAEYNLTLDTAVKISATEQMQRGLYIQRFLGEALRNRSTVEKAPPINQTFASELPLQPTPDSVDTTPNLETVSTASNSGIEAGKQFELLEDVAKLAIPSPSPIEGGTSSVDGVAINKSATMPVLVSKTRLQLLMEQQQQVAQEIEQTLREEEEQKKNEATVPHSEDLTMIVERMGTAEQRIEAMERWVQSFIGVMRQGVTLLSGDLPVGMPLPEVTADTDRETINPLQGADFSHEPVDIREAMVNTPRRKLQQLVNDYAEAKQYPYKEVWGYLYQQLHAVYGFNVCRGKHLKERYIDFVERSNQIDNLLSIAQSNLRPVMNIAQA